MASFELHTVENTNGERRNTLEAVQKNYGFVPNLLAGLAEAPATARAYMALGGEVTKTSFTPTERHVAWFAVNFYHDCHYCMPAHTAIAKSENIADDVVEAARRGGGYADPKLQALHEFATQLVEDRGAVDVSAVEEFLTAGYAKQHVLELVLVIAHKTISNYANHLMKTPVDAPFAEFAWEKAEAA
ncbi:MAG: carboxymuconolactone decarboxylase family protein [Pseudomonadota bacterium]